MRRAVAAPLVCLLLLVLGAPAAWGHAAFREREVPAESEQTIVLRVPEERPGETTVAVETLVPDGFEVLECPSEAPWTCEVEDGEERVILSWSRTGGGGDAELPLVVQTPTEPRDYRWPTIQTYDSGNEVAWAQQAGEDRPAPVLTVGAADAPVVEDTDDPADHGGSVTASEIPPTATETEVTPPVPPDTIAPTDPAASVSPVPADADDGGGPSIVTVVVIIAIVAAAVGALRMVRRGPAGGTPDGAARGPDDPA